MATKPPTRKLMWLKQCHKPSTFGNGLQTTHNFWLFGGWFFLLFLTTLPKDLSSFLLAKNLHWEVSIQIGVAPNHSIHHNPSIWGPKIMSYMLVSIQIGLLLNHPFIDGIVPQKIHPFGDPPWILDTPIYSLIAYLIWWLVPCLS